MTRIILRMSRSPGRPARRVSSALPVPSLPLPTPGREKPPVTVQSADPSGTQKTRLLDMIDSGQAEERTSFQTGAPWDPMLQLPADVAMCYGVGPDLAPRIKLWKEHGLHRPRDDRRRLGQLSGLPLRAFDGKRHVDEAQTDRRGNVISHGGDVYYMCPGPTFGNFLAQRVLRGHRRRRLIHPPGRARVLGPGRLQRRIQARLANRLRRETGSPPHSSPDAQYRVVAA